MFVSADGFKKVSSIEHGGLQPRADMEFQNSYFVRDHPDLMARIKRKVINIFISSKSRLNDK